MSIKLSRVILVGFLLGTLGWYCTGEVVPITDAEKASSLNRVIPLPKEFSVKEKIALASNQVRLRLAGTSGDVVKNAGNEFLGSLNNQNDQNIGRDNFEILLGVIDATGKIDTLDLTAQANRLKELPNSNQAYMIFPNGPQRLVVAGLHENGVYYGVKTLQQLLESELKKPTATIPLVTITDWPDIEQRGYWSQFSLKHIDKLASVKYNMVQIAVRPGFDQQRRGIIAEISPGYSTSQAERDNFINYCRLRGIQCIPYLGHLDRLSRTGIYELFPEVAGQGETARIPGRVWRAPCASQPKFAQVLAEWMMGMAALPYVNEISVWMTEEKVYCSCPRCLEQGEYVAEMRAIVSAWRMAQKTYPDLKLQLLLTQGSYPMNDKLIAEAPKDLRIVYYDGGRTYDSSKEAMIYPLLEKYASDGGWLGVMPQVTASWALVIPWSCPQFIKARMTEYADKKLHAMVGYAHPAIHLYDYNVTASGEWAWNAHGRTENQFTAAWAVRKNFENPQQVAQWTDLLGPASWNLYGSRFPYILLWEDAGQRIKAKTPPPWGKDILHYFNGPEDLDNNIRQCEKALELAKKINSDQIIEETLIVQAYYGMLKSISQIMTCVSQNPTLSEAQKQQLEQNLDQINSSAKQIAIVLPQWGQHYGISSHEGRLGNTIQDTQKIAESITKAVQNLTKK